MENKPLEGKACPPFSSAPQTLQTAAAYDRDQSAAPPFRPSQAQIWAAPFTYLLGWYYMRWLLLCDGASFRNWRMEINWLIPLFCVLFFGGCELLLRMAQKGRPTMESRLWMAFCSLLAVDLAVKNAIAFSYYEMGSLFVWEIWALHGAAAYWVVCRAGLLTEGGTGPFLPWDVLKALVVYPLGQFFLRLRVMWYGCKTMVRTVAKRRRRPNTAVWVTLLLALPLLLGAGALLASADAGFDRLLQNVLRWFTLPELPDVFWQNFWCFVFGLPVGAYLYGLLGSALQRQPKPEESERLRQKAEAARLAPAGALAGALLAFLALYLLFFAVQTGYLLGGFMGRLPLGFTAAQYARQGFFQLCAIVVLNFGLLTAAAKLTRQPVRRYPLLKTASLALMAANLLFAAVSFSKLYLYISRFGLTGKRVLSAWFTLVLAVLTLIAIASLLKPVRAARAAAIAFCGLFLALCLCQPGLLIQKGNEALYAAGVIQKPQAVQVERS